MALPRLASLRRAAGLEYLNRDGRGGDRDLTEHVVGVQYGHGSQRHQCSAPIEAHRNICKGVKEVALLFLAALVVENIVRGASVFNITVITGVIVSGALYYFAYHLMEKL